MSERTQAAQLRELRLRPERDRHPDQPALRRLLRPAERPGQPQRRSSFEAEIAADRGTAESLVEPRRRAEHAGRVERRAEPAQPRLSSSAPRRPDRDLQPDVHRAGATRGRRATRRVNSIAGLHAVLPRQRRPLQAGPGPDRRRAPGPGNRREGARQRLHDRPAPLARPAAGLDRAGRGVGGQGDERHATASPSSQTTVKPGDVDPRPEHAGDDQRQRSGRSSTSRCRTRAASTRATSASASSSRAAPRRSSGTATIPRARGRLDPDGVDPDQAGAATGTRR